MTCFARFYDNVGGRILDEVIFRMKPHGVIAAVGAVSLYSSFDSGTTLKSYLHLILIRVSLIGCTVLDHPELAAESSVKLAEAVKEGKLIIREAETVVDVKGKVEEIPRVWNGLFTGSNTGKFITKLAD